MTRTPEALRANLTNQEFAQIIYQAETLRASNAQLLAALKTIISTYRTFRNVPVEEQQWTSLDEEALQAGFAAIAQAKGA